MEHKLFLMPTASVVLVVVVVVYAYGVSCVVKKMY